MFERRLKVFLFILLLVTFTLILRAAQVQVLQHKAWELLAAKAMTRAEQVETRRGTIRDNKGVVIAMDEPCVDACLDYRALAPESDKDWPVEVARARLVDRMGSAFTGAKLDERKAMLAKEVDRVRDDIRQALPRLAKICGRTERELEDVRQATVEKVRMQRRFLWYHNYAAALEKHEDGEKEAQTRPSPGWMKWAARRHRGAAGARQVRAARRGGDGQARDRPRHRPGRADGAGQAQRPLSRPGAAHR